MALIEEAHKAARILLDHAYVRIVARAEPDATCAAALLAHALRRENVDFHVSWTRRLDDAAVRGLREERPDCLVTVGLSDDAAPHDDVAGRRLALDAVAPAAGAEAAVHGDAALASLAHLVAAGISRRNVDLAPLAVAGALAAWRHVGARQADDPSGRAAGFRGLDAEILQEALDARIMLREPALALHGSSLLAALSQMDAPFVAGVTGRARNAKKLLADLGLAADASPGALAEKASEELGDFLALRLLQQHAPDAAFDALFRPALRGLQGPHTGMECGEMALRVEAACAAARCGLGFAALWPDAAAGAEVEGLAHSFREELVAALLRAERDAKREGNLFVAEAPRAALCRPLADRLAASLAPVGCTTVVHAPDGDAAYVATRAWGAHAKATHAWAPDASRALKTLGEAVA
ncbi:MAG TPA: hypothetical protein VFH78_12740 [Candidatus Thermoplasmatota archaeon]|nr:hypothetical protein [Candidatus Thermoplasmatota archaeon]